MTWHPIDSTEHPAPRDEDTYILGRMGKIGILPCTWDADDQCWMSWNGFYERQFGKPFEPTHWQQIADLPPPKDEG